MDSFRSPILSAGKTVAAKRAAVPISVDHRPSEHPSLCLLGIGALVMIGVGIVANNPVVTGGGVLLVGMLLFVRLVSDLRSGVSSSNWGTWRRDENRQGFRLNIVFWGVVLLLCVALGVVVLCGVFQPPAT